MHSIGYHFYADGQGIYKSSRLSTERHIIINCAGNFVADAPISTKSLGRLDYYFLYIIDGSLKISANEQKSVLRAGDFLIVPPGTPYSYERGDNSTLRYFWVHYTGSDADNLPSRYKLKLYPEYNTTSDTSDVIASMRRFVDACASEEEFKEYELAILFERILLRLARKSSAGNSLPLKKSISHINAFYNTEIKIPALARMEGLSTSRYNAIFKKAIGISPCEYIIKTRLTFAQELLINTDLPIKEISVLVGYSDPHFFSRIFRSKVGVSPIEYRSGAVI